MGVQDSHAMRCTPDSGHLTTLVPYWPPRRNLTGMDCPAVAAFTVGAIAIGGRNPVNAKRTLTCNRADPTAPSLSVTDVTITLIPGLAYACARASGDAIDDRVSKKRDRSAEVATREIVRGLAVLFLLSVGGAAQAQSTRFPLQTSARLHAHNVIVRSVIFAGKRGVQVVEDSSIARTDPQAELLALIDGVAFSNGVIEAEIAGSAAPGAFEGARGFVGIAFRVQSDAKTYDAFYLRPTNGRAEDQERRNHAAQYISQPDWPWSRLRRESPSKYEAYADIQPGVWTNVRIEVHGDRARLYINGHAQPTLIVNDLKSGATASGGVALWIGPGTIGHFRHLTVIARP